VVSVNPTLHGVRPCLAMCLSKRGQHDAALAELNDDVKRTASVDADIAYAVASVYALEDDFEQAFEWLQRSIALGNENAPWLERDPTLASLREDPRFKQLPARIQVTP